MKTNVELRSKCPKCNAEFTNRIENMDLREYAPRVQGEIKPAGTIYQYRINSVDIKDFISKKVNLVKAGTSVEIIPVFTERNKSKGKRLNEHRNSYASLRIAYSENIIDEQLSSAGWYGKVGDDVSSLKIVKSFMDDFIRRYQYKAKDIESWLNDYKIMEELEQKFGMTEAYIKDLHQYVTPKRIMANNGSSWIIFAAAPENIIKDMLTNAESKQIPGKIQIQAVIPISEQVVEFVVYLFVDEIEKKNDPYVRQILLNELNGKK